MKQLSQYIDHTLLKSNATLSDIARLCDEALEYGFASVCVNPINVAFCSKKLKDSNVLVACVIGFPLGENLTQIKVAEASKAIEDGAGELDMVISVSRYLNGDTDYVLADIRAVVEAAGKVPVKVIIEAGLLQEQDWIILTKMCIAAGAAYIKTSTGFFGGATSHQVEVMKNAAGDAIKVKASGGIRTKEQALEMIVAGAERIGTSAGIAIVKG